MRAAMWGVAKLRWTSWQTHLQSNRTPAQADSFFTCPVAARHWCRSCYRRLRIPRSFRRRRRLTPYSALICRIAPLLMNNAAAGCGRWSPHCKTAALGASIFLSNSMPGLIRRAFPSVPWIFVYREPSEVLRSHARIAGSHMVQGVIEPEVYGWSGSQPQGGQLEYGAAVLTSICDAAYSALHNVGGGRVLDYAGLPDAVWSNLPEFFGITPTLEEIEHMKLASRHDAKSPSETFRRADLAPTAPLAPATAQRLAHSYLRLSACQ
jgi:hypothetical protein